MTNFNTFLEAHKAWCPSPVVDGRFTTYRKAIIALGEKLAAVEKNSQSMLTEVNKVLTHKLALSLYTQKGPGDYSSGSTTRREEEAQRSQARQTVMDVVHNDQFLLLHSQAKALQSKLLDIGIDPESLNDFITSCETVESVWSAADRKIRAAIGEQHKKDEDYRAFSADKSTIPVPRREDRGDLLPVDREKLLAKDREEFLETQRAGLHTASAAVETAIAQKERSMRTAFAMLDTPLADPVTQLQTKLSSALEELRSLFKSLVEFSRAENNIIRGRLLGVIFARAKSVVALLHPQLAVDMPSPKITS